MADLINEFLTTHTFESIRDFHFRLVEEASPAIRVSLPCLEYLDGTTHICFCPHFELSHESVTIDLARRCLIVAYCGFLLQHLTVGYPINNSPDRDRKSRLLKQLSLRGWQITNESAKAPPLEMVLAQRPYIRTLIQRQAPVVHEMDFIVPIW
jgi:hypothetical protein